MNVCLRKIKGLIADIFASSYKKSALFLPEIKRNILIPVQKELEGQALCWFNCTDKSFEKRQGKEVVGLSFKVITPQFEKMKEKQIDNIKMLLIQHFAFKPEHLSKIDDVFKAKFDFNKMASAVIRLHKYVQEYSKEIGNKQAYVIKSL